MLYGTIQQREPLVRNDQHSHTVDDTFKAVVFGFTDGLVTNMSLVLGIALARQDQGAVVLVGMAGLFSGAFSMACGEWLSDRAERDRNRRQMDLERLHLQRIPDEEARHMKEILTSHGVSPATADLVNRDVMALPIERQLRFHGRFELGIDPDYQTPQPCCASLRTAAAMWLAFAVGALVPVLPWMVLPGRRRDALAGSVLGSLCAVLCATLYQVRGHYRDLAPVLLRQVAVSALAVGCTLLFQGAAERAARRR